MNSNELKATIHVEKRRDFVYITFTGVLEYGIINSVKKNLHEQLLESEKGYIINMKNVSNIDSTGFGMIVNFARKVSVNGNNIAIIVVDDFVRTLFAISQCDKVFPIVTSEWDKGTGLLSLFPCWKKLNFGDTEPVPASHGRV